MYTQEEKEFAASFKALCTRYGVSMSWKWDDGELRDYLISGNNVNLYLFDIVYGDMKNE